MISRIRNTLLLGALGDALGAPIEFEWGPFGDHPSPPNDQFEWTDDTQMSLFVAEAIFPLGATAPIDAVRKASRDAIVRWYLTQGHGTAFEPPDTGPLPTLLLKDGRMHRSRAPGRSCMAGGARLLWNPDYLPTLETIDDPNGGGCGAVMRAAPYGLAAPTMEAAWEWAIAGAVMTHGHPLGYNPAAIQAALVWLTSHGSTLIEAVGTVMTHPLFETVDERTAAVFTKAVAFNTQDAGLFDETLTGALGSNFDGATVLATAVYCALHAEKRHDGAERALWRAVAHRGDSDSVGAVAGGLLGAMGLDAPPDWVEALRPKGGVVLIDAVAALAPVGPAPAEEAS